MAFGQQRCTYRRCLRANKPPADKLTHSLQHIGDLAILPLPRAQTELSLPMLSSLVKLWPPALFRPLATSSGSLHQQGLDWRQPLQRSCGKRPQLDCSKHRQDCLLLRMPSSIALQYQQEFCGCTRLRFSTYDVRVMQHKAHVQADDTIGSTMKPVAAFCRVSPVFWQPPPPVLGF